MVQARPRRPAPGQRALRLAVLHAGAPAPGMNTAVRAPCGSAMDRGHTVLGRPRRIPRAGRGGVEELDWMSVSGWGSRPAPSWAPAAWVPGAGDLSRHAHQLGAHRSTGCW